MAESGSKRVWWWLLLFLILGGLIGYLLRGDLGKESEWPVLLKKGPPAAEKSVSPTTQASPSAAEKGTTPTGSAEKVVLPVQPLVKKAPPHMEVNLKEFFHYLDQKPYVRHLQLGTGTYEQFKIILKKLSTHLPVPAGEGIDPRILTANVYFFFRTLDWKDLRLIKEVVRHESDNMEMDLDMFYRWFTQKDGNPETARLRPSLSQVYPYAGFLLNTIGGRAYLWRRAPEVRVLLTYYCILIVYRADQQGKNTYGIDIYPFVRSLENEMTHYPDLQYQQEYLDKLEKIRQYYIKKR